MSFWAWIAVIMFAAWFIEVFGDAKPKKFKTQEEHDEYLANKQTEGAYYKEWCKRNGYNP